jgi:hypothetical protein
MGGVATTQSGKARRTNHREPRYDSRPVSPTLRAIAATLLLAPALGGCAAERTIYRDSDGRIREQWNCPYKACLGIGGPSRDPRSPLGRQ